MGSLSLLWYSIFKSNEKTNVNLKTVLSCEGLLAKLKIGRSSDTYTGGSHEAFTSTTSSSQAELKLQSTCRRRFLQEFDINQATIWLRGVVSGIRQQA